METENILIDWTLEMYLNFTHIGIMDRLNAFYQKFGVMERLHGDIYVAQTPFQQIELEWYVTKKNSIQLLTLDLY